MTRMEAERAGIIPRFNPNDPATKPPVGLKLREIYTTREAICRACEHLIGGIRCGNLNCGCPKSANRVEPWKNLPRCDRWNTSSSSSSSSSSSQVKDEDEDEESEEEASAS